MTDQKIPEILTIREAAKILNVHSNTLRMWDKDGTLKAIRFGKRGDRKYRKDELLQLIKRQT